MITTRRLLPGIAAIGSAMAIFMFLITLSFFITTPHIDPGSQGFLIKDILLLSVAIWNTGESLAEFKCRATGMFQREEY